MPRSAPPVQPGTTPADATASDTPAADAFTANVTMLGEDEAAQVGEALTDAALQTEVAKSENAELAAMLAAMNQRMAKLEADNQRLAANQRTVTSSVPEPVELPSLKEVMAKSKAALARGEPEVPLLSKDGWYVPATLGSPAVAKA